MATDRDFTYKGGAQDERLERMRVAMPDFEDSDPISMIAGLRFLDEDASLAADEINIAMVPGFAMWILPCVEIQDPALKAALAAEDDVAFMAALNTSPFIKVAFTLEGAAYPDNLAGKVINLHIMTDAESQRADFGCATLDSAGKVIRLPKQVNGMDAFEGL